MAVTEPFINRLYRTCASVCTSVKLDEIDDGQGL